MLHKCLFLMFLCKLESADGWSLGCQAFPSVGEMMCLRCLPHFSSHLNATHDPYEV